MTLQSKITAANAQFTSFVTAADNFMTWWLANSGTGRYWQGLPSHTTAPDGDATEDTDNFASEAHPGESWNANPGGAGNGLKAALRNVLENGSEVSGRLDIYQAPNGHGYHVRAQFTYDGELYQRTHSVGPDDRSTGTFEQIS